jgi:uncharacterized glyoxalase superfamily protein PhnB
VKDLRLGASDNLVVLKEPSVNQSVFPNLIASDLEVTSAWYQKNLGATFKMSVPSKTNKSKACFTTLSISGNDVMFQTVENIEGKYKGLEKRIAAGYGVALNIQVADAQAVYDALEDTSSIIAEPADTFYGMREFTIEDPNGYLLTVASMLKK